MGFAQHAPRERPPRRRFRLTPAHVGILLTFGAGCGPPREEPFHKPEAPDMSALVALYDAPTGTLDEGDAATVLQAAQPIVDKIAALNITQPLIDAVNASVAGADGGDDDSEGGLTQASGHLLVTRICNGWEPEPVPDPANGTLGLTVGFTETGLDPVIWGEIERCLYLVGSSRVALGGLRGSPIGSVRFHLGGVLPFEGLASARLLFDFDLSAELDGQGLDADFDYRLDPTSASLEVRVPVADGDVIVLVSGTGVAGVRAQNGDFVCDESASTCEQR